jgi:ribosomal protein S18 acetylase RimI-like enzyme
MSPAIALRPVINQDEPFLYEVFKTGLGSQFAELPWPPEAIEQLVRMQFNARHSSYSSQYPNSQHSIVLAGGVEAGHIWVHRDESSLHLIEIELLPQYRGQGIGSSLFRDLMKEAEAAGVPLLSGVATNNPGSLALHRRLGFEIISQDELYWYLEWRSPAASGAGH